MSTVCLSWDDLFELLGEDTFATLTWADLADVTWADLETTEWGKLPFNAHATSVALLASLGDALNLDERGCVNTDLLGFLDGPGHLLGEVDDLARDTAQRDGWAHLLDPNSAPSEALGWLAQLAGVTLHGDLDETAQRARITETAGQRRGTVAALKGTARQHLTGSQLVRVEERTTSDGQADPYHLRVTTFTAETPDPQAVEDALAEQTPAGLILTYRVLEGQTWDDVVSTYATWDDVLSAHPSWDDLITTLPG